jgi:MFS family permease
MKTLQPFQWRTIVSSYGSMMKTKDFTSGMIILGLAYAMVFVYGMASPFLIENRLHFPASVTGYCSLFSGFSVLIGGSLSRILIQKPFFKKLIIANSVQFVAAGALIVLTLYHQNLFTLLIYVFLLHSMAGFIFNSFFSYCLIRFPKYAGKASGLVGGGFAVVTSVFSSMLINSITITNQVSLGIAYGVLAVGIFLLLVSTKWKGSNDKNEELGLPYIKNPVWEESVA